MKLEDPVLSWILTDERLRSLSSDQCQAVIEALLAVVLADGRRTDDEMRRVRRELMRLPWRWDHKQEDAERALEAAQAHLTAHAADVASGALAAQVAARLPELPAREAVLKMLFAVAIADGITASEEARIATFRDAFAITPERAHQLRGAAGTSNPRP